MKRPEYVFLFACIFALLLAQPAFSQETTIAVAVEKEPDALFMSEGQAIKFEAKIQHNEPDTLQLDWDFGDGTKISGNGKDYMKIRHSYFLDSTVKKRFETVLSVSDALGNSGTAKTSVWIEPAELSILPVSGTTYVSIEKPGKAKLQVKVLG